MQGEERLTFESEGLRLVGMLAIPSAASTAVVVCHPHPQYGGSMDNNVVCAVALHLQNAGIATLRFNFRGVDGSEGGYGNLVGEAADARAAVGFLAARSGIHEVALAGYSFGAMIALRVGRDHPTVDRLIGVAPPLAFFDLDFLADCRKPKLLLAGDQDEYCSRDAFQRAVRALRPPMTVHLLPGADHFFWGFEEQIGEQVVQFMRGRGNRV